jgi:hypothetical protein
MGELGRYPLCIGVIISMYKYLKSVYTNEDILLRNVFSESKYLYENGQKSWFSSMESLVRYLNISPNIFKLPGIDMKSLFLNKLKTLCNKIWKEEIVNDSRNNTGGNKFRTYRLCKHHFSFEPYLLHSSKEKRKLLTKFRISAHKLEIEHGRYHKLPIANHICSLCKTEVGDEIHFLLQCATLNKTRSNFIKYISVSKLQ